MTQRPLEIIGGGLAGLSLGVALQRNGVATAVHEAGDYPRHRVCGEFIAGLGAGTRARLGLDAVLHDARRHEEVAWCLGNGTTRVQRLPAPALGLSRHTLDARLADAFRAAGGELHLRTRITDFEPRPGRIFASGRRRGRSPWLGLKLHVRGLTLTRDLELHLGAHAYVGLCGVENGRTNVCGLFRRRPLASRGSSLLLQYLRASGLRELAGRIESAEICDDSICAVAALSFDRRVRSAARIRIGDACAMIPPFTGNGMAMAFQSAELALDPLLAYARDGASWEHTCSAVTAALRKQFRARLASATAVHPLLLHPGAQRWVAALNRARLLPFGALYAAMH